MSRLAALLVLCLALSLGACAGSSADASAPRPRLMNEEGAAATAPPVAPASRPGKSTGVARAGEWAWKGPLNAVYWPWKLVGKTGRGIADGIGAGFEVGRLPFLGLIMSPINAATGALTGLVEGVVLSPMLLTPETDADKAFVKPLTAPTTIWWY